MEAELKLPKITQTRGLGANDSLASEHAPAQLRIQGNLDRSCQSCSCPAEPPTSVAGDDAGGVHGSWAANQRPSCTQSKGRPPLLRNLPEQNSHRSSPMDAAVSTAYRTAQFRLQRCVLQRAVTVRLISDGFCPGRQTLFCSFSIIETRARDSCPVCAGL